MTVKTFVNRIGMTVGAIRVIWYIGDIEHRYATDCFIRFWVNALAARIRLSKDGSWPLETGEQI
jgi:hypothetical protein